MYQVCLECVCATVVFGEPPRSASSVNAQVVWGSLMSYVGATCMVCSPWIRFVYLERAFGLHCTETRAVTTAAALGVPDGLRGGDPKRSCISRHSVQVVRVTCP